METNKLKYNKLLEDYNLITHKISNISHEYFEKDEIRRSEIKKLKNKQILIFNQLQELKNTEFNNIKNNKKYPDNKKFDDKISKKIKEFENLCLEITPKLNDKYPFINKNSHKKSLIIETRNQDHLEFIIKNTIQKLGDGWGHIIYCHENNLKNIKKICDEISSEIEINLLESEVNRDTYNDLMLDLNFWEKIKCEKIFIYQTDTFLFKNIEDKFLEYDWIGWPWPESHTKFIEEKLNWKDLWGCNGGLNIRTVSVIKEILKKIPIPKKNLGDMKKIPEDTFFSWYIKKYYKFPPKEECFLFSEDRNFNENTFGTHQPWLGSMKDFIKKVNTIYNVEK